MKPKQVWQEIVQAVSADDFDRALELVQKNPSVATVKGNKGRTLLHEVSTSFQSFEPVQPIIRALVEAGADIEAKDREGWTPLLQAAGPPQPNLEALQTLLELGADVNANIEGLSPLHLAVYERSRPGEVALLITHGADVHARDREGITPLHFAAARGLTEDVRVLVEHGARIDAATDDGLTPLGYACAFAWPEIIAWLGERTREEPLSAVRLAEIGLIHEQVERGSVANVAAMIAHKPELLTAKSRLGGWTPMAIAAREGRIDMLEALVAHGGDVNEVNDSGYNLVCIATSNQRDAVKRWLLDHGVAPAHQARKPNATRSKFSWQQITVAGDQLFLPSDVELSRLRNFLGCEPPADYVQYIQRFGSGDLDGQLYIFTPDRIIANHEMHQSILDSRFPPAEFPYENGSDLFKPEQVKRIVIAAGVDNSDSLGFVRGETGWYLFPRDGLIEHTGRNLEEVMAWLIRNEVFGKKPKLRFKPIDPK